MKKVIIFDFDNTLVESIPDWRQMIDHDTAIHYGVTQDPSFESTRHGLTNYDTAKYFLKLHNITNVSADEVITYWYDCMADRYKNHIPIIKGAEEFLSYLQNKGYKLVIATATGRSLLNRALDAYGLEKYFDYIICEEDVGKSKKYPDIYNKIMEKFNVQAQDCLYFEDSSIALSTASSIGIDCVALTSEFNKDNQEYFDKICVLTIEHYSQELIKKLSL